MLPPYRHELRHVVKPLVDAFTSDRSRALHTRFDTILDELEDGVNDGRWQDVDLEDQYTTVADACRDTPGEVSDAELADALAAATIATGTDILGAFYQLAGRTSDHFDQYFTPPNVAVAVNGVAQETAVEFEPPEVTADNVNGQSSFDAFADGGEPEPTSTPPAEEPAGTVVFDPACGSGRLLAAAARYEQTCVALGWEIERTAARMAAVTLALTNTPGWIVRGDSTTMEANTIWRVAPLADQPLQELSPTGNPELPSTCDNHETPEQGLPEFDGGVPAAACVEELQTVLQRGVDRVVANPPFNTCDIDPEYDRGAADRARFDVAHKDIGDMESGTRTSQRYEWLMLEHALNLTRADGAVSFVVPTSLLAIQSESECREWLMNTAFLTTSIELPEATFQPETHTQTGIITVTPRSEQAQDVDVDYEIFMAMAETMGHTGSAEQLALTEDGDSVTVESSELPNEYTAHQWVGREEVTVPDDDLRKVLSEYGDFVQPPTA